MTQTTRRTWLGALLALIGVASVPTAAQKDPWARCPVCGAEGSQPAQALVTAMTDVPGAPLRHWPEYRVRVCSVCGTVYAPQVQAVTNDDRRR